MRGLGQHTSAYWVYWCWFICPYGAAGNTYNAIYASIDIKQVRGFVNGVLKYCSVVDGIVQDSNPHNYVGRSDIAPQVTHWVNLCGASDRATQFTGYIGVGLCGASGTYFTGLVCVCRLTPELPFRVCFGKGQGRRGPKVTFAYLPRPWAQFHKT
jgi:hypothetical protein